MTRLRDLSKYIQVDVSSTRLNRVWASVAARLPIETRRRWWLNWATVSTLALGLVFATWRLALRSQPGFPTEHAIVETSSDTSNVQLVDGSRLEVAAKTRIEWSTRSGRAIIVKLTRGRVDCDVIPRQDQQFSVQAADVRVQVTGTRFSVSYSPESGHIDVAVQRGSVNIATVGNSDPNRHLAAGERWSTDRGSQQTVEKQTDSSGVVSPSPTPTASQPTSSGSAVVSTTGTLPETAGPPAQESLSAHTLMDQGNAARRAGDARGAASAYQTLLSRFPKDARAGLAAFELGRLRMGSLGDIPGAIKAFQRAITLSPSRVIREDSMAHLVEAYAASGQTGSCVAAREAYLKTYPNGVHVGSVQRQCGGP